MKRERIVPIVCFIIVVASIGWATANSTIPGNPVSEKGDSQSLNEQQAMGTQEHADPGFMFVAKSDVAHNIVDKLYWLAIASIFGFLGFAVFKEFRKPRTPPHGPDSTTPPP